MINVTDGQTVNISRDTSNVDIPYVAVCITR